MMIVRPEKEARIAIVTGNEGISMGHSEIVRMAIDEAQKPLSSIPITTLLSFVVLAGRLALGFKG